MIKFKISKYNILSVSLHQVNRTRFNFKHGDAVLKYKYLNYNVTAQILANRIPVAVINRYKSINSVGYYTHTKLFQCGI